MAQEPFTGTRVTAKVDKTRTRRQAADSPLWDVYLVLDPQAPSQWSRIFNDIWDRVTYSMKRDARAVGSAIVIEGCALEEVDKYHLPILRQAVERVNEQYRILLKREAQEQQRQQAQDEQDRADLDALARRLEPDGDS